MTGYCPWGDIGSRYPDIEVIFRDIAPVRAAWIARPRVILVDLALSRRERRSVLAHELGHVDLGHRHRGYLWFDGRQEREADMLAARRLITVGDLADALASTRDEDELAELLNVDTHTLRVRCEHLHPSERHHVAARVARVEHVA